LKWQVLIFKNHILGFFMPSQQTQSSHYSDPRPLIERALVRDPKSGKVRRSVTINLAESPLSWLYARGHLTQRQFQAGELLRDDYEAAAIGPKITMNWENIPCSRERRSAPSITHSSERVYCAKDRFDGAIAAMGRDLADIAWRVICAGEGIAYAERTMAWPARSGKLVLKIALDRLAEYYWVPG
jgi:hypothetical protein